jgi:hypothetical protein
VDATTRAGGVPQPQVYDFSKISRAEKFLGRHVRIETAKGDGTTVHVRIDTTFEKKMREIVAKATGHKTEYVTGKKTIEVFNASDITAPGLSGSESLLDAQRKVARILAKQIAVSPGEFRKDEMPKINPSVEHKVFLAESNLLKELSKKNPFIAEVVTRLHKELEAIPINERRGKILEILSSDYGIDLKKGTTAESKEG